MTTIGRAKALMAIGALLLLFAYKANVTIPIEGTRVVNLHLLSEQHTQMTPGGIQ